MGFQSAIMHAVVAFYGGSPISTISMDNAQQRAELSSQSGLFAMSGRQAFLLLDLWDSTCTSTENYWSDLGAYDGMVHLSRQLAFSEPVIAEGRLRPARIAILYSISSDLWQPFAIFICLSVVLLILHLYMLSIGVDFCDRGRHRGGTT